MLKKVVFYVNYNLYESKRYFTHKLAEAFERQGIKTRIFDVKELEINKKTVEAIEKEEPDLTCSFNTILPLSDRRFLWDLIKIPHLSILVDPAIYSINLIDSPYSIISTVDRFDCAALQAQNFKRAFFWPHAVEKELTAPAQQQRNYPVVFIGSCYDYEGFRRYWHHNFSSPIAQALDEAAEIVLNQTDTTITEALVQTWNQHQIGIEGVNFEELFYLVDYYTRGKERIDLIRSIKSAPVHVFGELSREHASSQSGWEHYLSGMTNVDVHPSLPFPDSLEVLQQGKICLNSMPFFKHGSHERILTGLACGAVPITNANHFVRHAFKVGEELIGFQSGQLGDLDAQVQDLLQHEDKRQAIAQKGDANVKKNHTWDKRVQQLQEVFGTLAFDQTRA